MALHDDLLKQARRLVTHEPRRPKQATLRRAISTAYYAVFHLLLFEGSHAIVPRKGHVALREAIGRAFQHREMDKVARAFAADNPARKIRRALDRTDDLSSIRDVAHAFSTLQQARHEADYNVSTSFTREEARELVETAEACFLHWKDARHTDNANAFLVALLLQDRIRA